MAPATTLQRVALVVGGAGFLLFGVYFLLNPSGLFQAVGVAGPTPQALLPELRSFYGGLEIGLGLFILTGLVQATIARPALWLMVCVYLGAALGRALGIGIDGVVNSYMLIAGAVELAVAMLAFSALRLGQFES